MAAEQTRAAPRSGGLQRILIIGGGFAGATAARRLAGRMPPGTELTLLSEDSYVTFNPMLPEVVGGAVFPEHVVVPLREILGRCAQARFVMGAVRGIDRAARAVMVDTLAGRLELPYDQLVLALGSEARLDLLPGMAAHAVPLKSIGDALHLRNLALRRLAAMEIETDAERKRLLGRFLVIGGGFSGVEVAGALADFLKSALDYFPRLKRGDVSVALVHDGPRLLPEMHSRLGSAAVKILMRDGVAVHTSTRVLRLMPTGAETDAGVLEAGTMVGTIGIMPNRLIATLGVPTERGRIAVNPDLSVPDAPGLWALGDCAIVPNARDGTISPPTAQFAVRQARLVADNLLAVTAGRAPRAFSYRPRGSMAAIGHRNGVADVLGLKLTGLPAWLAWRAFYLSQVPSLARKLRLFGEWTWEMAFRADVTHIHFRRSGEVNALLPEPVEVEPA
jgi:NADH dehydrogenase